MGGLPDQVATPLPALLRFIRKIRKNPPYLPADEDTSRLILSVLSYNNRSLFDP